MEEEKKENNMYTLAKKYVAMSAAHVKARLLNTHGQEWLDENWAKFNKLRTVVKAKPSKKIAKVIERRQHNVKVGMTEERANDIEKVVEKLGVGTNAKLSNFFTQVKEKENIERVNFNNLAEEQEVQYEKIKALEAENEELKARVSKMENILRDITTRMAEK